tara:strand:+ start:9683 stop:10048 length:366 start_codon:yes stop_codon:yes gene_type:complete
VSEIFIGVDIEDISRIRSVIQTSGNKFLNRVYTNKEQIYCQKKADPAIHFAGRFCAKEALIKALKSSGIEEHIPWKAIEIDSTESRKPEVNLSDNYNGISQVSISHTETQAIAFALFYTKL